MFYCRDTKLDRRHRQSSFPFTYFQAEDHQTKVPLSRNLKIWVTLYVRLQELCHLNRLKTREENKHVDSKASYLNSD